MAIGYQRGDAEAAQDSFIWSPAVGKVNFPGCPALLAKKLRCVAYMLELAYELLVSPSADVSRNAGFEACLGIFQP